MRHDGASVAAAVQLDQLPSAGASPGVTRALPRSKPERSSRY